MIVLSDLRLYQQLLKGELNYRDDFKKVDEIFSSIESNPQLMRIIEHDKWSRKLYTHAEKEENYLMLSSNDENKEEHFRQLVIELTALTANLFAIASESVYQVK